MLNAIEYMGLSTSNVKSPANCEPPPTFAAKNSFNSSIGVRSTIRAEIIHAPRSIAAAVNKIFRRRSIKKNRQNANATCGLSIARLNRTPVKSGRRSRKTQHINSRQQITPPALPVTVEMKKLAGHANSISAQKFFVSNQNRAAVDVNIIKFMATKKILAASIDKKPP